MIEATSRHIEFTLLTSNYSQMPAVALQHNKNSLNISRRVKLLYEMQCRHKATKRESFCSLLTMGAAITSAEAGDCLSYSSNHNRLKVKATANPKLMG